MARRSIRNAVPAPSNAARDKLKAALGYTYGEMATRGAKSAEYERAPLYFDSLWQWYQALNADRQELVTHIIDAWSLPDRRKAAEQWAAHLPAAPRFLRELE
jgi:hypothetical protein